MIRPFSHLILAALCLSAQLSSGETQVKVTTLSGAETVAVLAGSRLSLTIRIIPGTDETVSGLAYCLEFPDIACTLTERTYGNGWEQGGIFDNSVPSDTQVPPTMAITPDLYPATPDSADIRFDNAFGTGSITSETRVETVEVSLPADSIPGHYSIRLSSPRAYDNLGSPIPTVAAADFLLTIISPSTPETPCGSTPRFGFNLPNWTHNGPGLENWKTAIDDMFSVSVRDICLITYRFVDTQTGDISSLSSSGLPSPPPDSELSAAILYAKQKGMRVTVSPFLYIDGGSDIGDPWRGYLNFSPEKLQDFFTDYITYISTIAELAETACADRLMIGSELEQLTGNQEAEPYWYQVIAEARLHFSGTLTYAANGSEYATVPFWSWLDEIGIDAYFPLATPEETAGEDFPTVETIEQNWQDHIAVLRAFSEAQGKPVLLAEWGCVPFEGTTAQPWDWQVSDTPDPGERDNAYQATINTFSTRGDWLNGVFFWHWAMPGNSSSKYAVSADSAPAQYLFNYLGDLFTCVIEIVPGWNTVSFPFDPAAVPLCGFQAELSGWEKAETGFRAIHSFKSFVPYWFHSKHTCFISQHSEIPGSGKSSIHSGWNAFITGAGMPLTDLPDNRTVWEWNPATQMFFSFGSQTTGHPPSTQSPDSLQPGKVYFFRR